MSTCIFKLNGERTINLTRVLNMISRPKVRIWISIWTEVLTTVSMKSCVFWDIVQYSPVKIDRLFGETYLLVACYTLFSYLAYCSNCENGDNVALKRRSSFTGPRDVTSPSTDIFIDFKVFDNNLLNNTGTSQFASLILRFGILLHLLTV
jgi:hypothetical protein